MCSNKGTNWKFIFPWRKINWHVLEIPKAHFTYLIWIMICGKSIIHTIFTMVMHACTKSLSKQAYKINCLQEFPIFLALNYYTFMCTCNPWTHIYLQKEGISKHSGKQEIMQLVWTIVTRLILNMKPNMILALLMEFACIRHSWTLQMNLTVC